jgi:hypothetical protein
MLTLPPTRMAPAERKSERIGAADLEQVIDAVPVVEGDRRLVPIGRGLVVDPAGRAQRLGARKLRVARRGNDRNDASRVSELQAEDGDAAGALQQHRLAGDQLGVIEHRLPGGHCGAGQRRALVDRKMRRDFHDAFFFQHHIFGQHAVGAAAERGRVHMRSGLAAGPALEEAAGDLVTGFDAHDAGSGFDHFAGAVRQWNDIFTHRCPVAAAHDAEVAIVERTGDDLNQHLAVGRFRHGPLDHGQSFDAGAGLGQLVGTHSSTSGACTRARSEKWKPVFGKDHAPT